MAGRASLTVVALKQTDLATASSPNIDAGASITVYEVDGTTLLAQTMYDAATGGGAVANPFVVNSLGYKTVYVENAQPVMVKVGSASPIFYEFVAAADDHLYLNRTTRLMNRTVGPGTYAATGTYLNESSAAGSVAHTAAQFLSGVSSDAGALGHHDAVVIIQKDSAYDQTGGANPALYVSHTKWVNSASTLRHATAIQVEALDVYGGPQSYTEGLRTQATLTATSVLGSGYGIVTTAAVDVGGTYAHLIGIESAVIQSVADAPLGDSSAPLVASSFAAAYNATAAGTKIPDVAYIVSPLTARAFRTGLHVPSGSVTEAAVRALGTMKYGVDLRDLAAANGTTVLGAIAFGASQNILGKFTGTATARTRFVSSDTNSSTILMVAPSLGGTVGGINLYDKSDLTGALLSIALTSGEARLTAADSGAGAPFFTIYAASPSAEQLRIAANGDFTLKSSKAGFFSATPVVQRGQFIQTYSTADRTLSAYTPNVESSAFTGIATGVGGTPYAQLTDLNALRVAYENLRAFCEDATQMLNALVDDSQALGFAT